MLPLKRSHFLDSPQTIGLDLCFVWDASIPTQEHFTGGGLRRWLSQCGPPWVPYPLGTPLGTHFYVLQCVLNVVQCCLHSGTELKSSSWLTFSWLLSKPASLRSFTSDLLEKFLLLCTVGFISPTFRHCCMKVSTSAAHLHSLSRWKKTPNYAHSVSHMIYFRQIH